MKCAAIKLSSRPEQSRRKIRKQAMSPTFTGEEGHSYSFPFSRPKTTKLSPSSTITITNINLPDNTPCFNTGSSLDRWSQKGVRLKSAKISKTPTEFDKEFCYETLETDLSDLLNDTEELPHSPCGSLDNLQYEVHSDIEKLLEETQRSAQENNNQNHRRKKRGKDKKKAKNLKFSKPSSPQTEQVIRVDVTSTISANEDKRRDVEIRKPQEEEKIEISDDCRKELKRNFKESTEEMCDDDFIVRCRQLALRQKRRLR